MFFSVKELEHRKIHFDVTYPPGEIVMDEAWKQVGDLQAQGVAELLGNTLGEIRVQGHLKVTMEGNCDRCLEPSRVPLDTGFNLFYRPAGDDLDADEVALDEGESEMGFYEGAGLALEDVLREQVLLDMPMHPVCREECKGICPVCGQNRNQSDCGCEARPSDDRWAALRELKRSLS